MSFYDTNALPPAPYARVRLVRTVRRRSHTTLCVPLHWLHDWPRALDARSQIGHHSWTAQPAAPVFRCFYKPGDWARAPSFNGPPLLQGDVDDVELRTSAVYTVHVLSVVQPDAAREYRGVRHAHVRVRDCGTQLTVPVRWLRDWETLRLQADGETVVAEEAEREWRCYYEAPRYAWKAHRVPSYTRFAVALARAWYTVHVVRVFEGECVLFV